jgi:Amt family ammonium transporter
MQTMTGMALLSTLWFIVGYTLTFGVDASGIIGDLSNVFYNNVPYTDSVSLAPTIPGITFATYQMMFAVITPLLITGAFAERMKWSAFIIFVILWSLIVYYPLAHWIWGGGWLAKIGVYDFAGGIVIHVSAGMAALASALVLGRRKGFGPEIMVPHNLPLAAIGATLLWLGWFGFNAGSALASGTLAASALLATQIGAATCALVWVCLSWKRTGKPTVSAVINGAISGLAGITPAAGFISGQWAFVLGIVLGFASYYGIVLIKERLKIDDVLDVSSVHGITGITGALWIGLFASSAINPAGPDGWFYGNPMQLAIQAFGIGVGALLAFVGTVVILKLIDITVGIRVKEEEEDLGLDISYHQEVAYENK